MFAQSIPEVSFVPKMRFLHKETFFTIYLRNNIRFLLALQFQHRYLVGKE